MTFANGDVFSGHFLDDVMHGPGIFTPNGSEPEEGEWLHGDRVVEAVEEESTSEEEEETFEFNDDIMEF